MVDFATKYAHYRSATKLIKKFTALCLLSFCTTAHAGVTDMDSIIVAPTCLLKNVKVNYQVLSVNDDLVLAQIKEKDKPLFIKAKQQQRKKFCGGFMDVTQDYQTVLANPAHYLQSFNLASLRTHKKAGPYQIQYEKEVQQALLQLNPQEMWSNLTTLTASNDRYANSENGVQAAHWLKQQAENLAKTYNRKDVSVYLVSTGRYQQPSVVVKVGNADAPGVVIGAHMDTTSGRVYNKPGADDDGTGTVTVLETMRTLLANGLEFQKPLYFIWYAAEEEGLVGSGYVVADFKRKNIRVDAVIHFDMTGFVYQNDDALWLIRDYVDLDLSNYLETLINTYVKKPVKYTRCGYACSDHASWTQKGYIAAMPAETAFENTNPSMHTSRDTMDKLSLVHMTDYAKLAIAFAIELAKPIKS